MVQNEKDKKIEKISKLLEQGGTMLANHCKCGAPLFRYHGNVICPICDSQLNKNENKKEEEIKKNYDILDRPSVQSLPTPTSFFKSTTQSMAQSTNEINKKINASILSSTTITPETQEFISNMIINKVVELCSDLENETDLNRIKKQLETIGYGIKVLSDILEQNPR